MTENQKIRIYVRVLSSVFKRIEQFHDEEMTTRTVISLNLICKGKIKVLNTFVYFYVHLTPFLVTVHFSF